MQLSFKKKSWFQEFEKTQPDAVMIVQETCTSILIFAVYAFAIQGILTTNFKSLN